MPSTKGRTLYKFNVIWEDAATKKKYKKTFSSSSAVWADGPRQEVITVLYDPQNPSRSAVDIDSSPDNEPIVLGAVLTLVAALGFAFMRHSSKKNREWMEKELEIPL